MAEDLIVCPSCSFRLRLPPDLYGQEVECPQCHTRFVAPAPQPGAGLRPPPGREYDATGPVGGQYPTTSSSSGANLTAPGICLLVTALLGAAVNGYMAVSFLAIRANPAEFERQMEQQMEQQHRDMTPEQKEQVKQFMTGFKDYGLGAFVGLAVLNLVTALGAVMMLMRKGYAIAVLGSIIGLNPVNFGCCFLGQLPFALWSLIVLLGSSKQAFR